MKTERKTFDLGLYRYTPVQHGLICPVDEAKLKTGQVLAVLLPMRKVDPKGLYCFALTNDCKIGTVTVMRKNIKFNRVITLSYQRPELSTYAQETHLAIDTAQLYLQQQPGTQALIELDPPPLMKVI